MRVNSSIPCVMHCGQKRSITQGRPKELFLERPTPRFLEALLALLSLLLWELRGRVSRQRAAYWAPWQLGKNWLSIRESGTAVPLLTSAASAPWRPSHTGASMLDTKSFRTQRSLAGTHVSRLMWENFHMARGFRITKCYPSVVDSYASCFRDSTLEGGGGFGSGWKYCTVVFRTSPTLQSPSNKHVGITEDLK